MTAGEFVTHTDLTFLGDIDLCHLQNTRRQFVTNGDSKLTTLILSIKQLVLLDEVDNKLLNKFIRMLILGPAIRLDAIVFEILQGGNRELGTFGDDLSTGIVFNTLRDLTLGQGHQFVNEDILQIVHLCFIFLINLAEDNLILFLRLTGLHGTREEFLIDHDTCQ